MHAHTENAVKVKLLQSKQTIYSPQKEAAKQLSLVCGAALLTSVPFPFAPSFYTITQNEIACYSRCIFPCTTAKLALFPLVN
jgi:hypothetical protein